MSRRAVAAGALAFVLAAGGAAVGAEPEPGGAESEVAFTFTDPRIDESSGLVANGGLVVTVNDSGDENRIFTIDPATGDTVGVTTWQGDAVDVEALAPAGDGDVWVGDIGDNAGTRSSVSVSRVPFGRGDQSALAPTYELVYPDGAHDAETLLADPSTGRLYVVAKEFRGRMYAAPEQLRADGPNRLEEVGQALALATDGTFTPDGQHVILRNYAQASVYAWPDMDRVGGFTLPVQQQGEGLAVTPSGEVLVSTEGAGSDVMRVELPADLRTALAEPAPDDDSSPRAAPNDDARDAERDLWPWALGGVAGLIVIVVLVRSLRPR